MSDIFKLILEGAKRTRPQQAVNTKLNSILNTQESQNYSKQKDKKTNDLFAELDNISVGEERDVTDHLSEIKKLSMKELDKLNPKEQLKILKLEYNRIFDKLDTLNKKSVDNERTISDLQMAQRTSGDEVRHMKNLIRVIVHSLPGNATLKENIDRGSWKPSDIDQDVLSAMKSIIDRIKNSEDILSREKEVAEKEMTKLREMILAYKENFAKAEDLMKEQHSTIQTLKAQIASNTNNNTIINNNSNNNIVQSNEPSTGKPNVQKQSVETQKKEVVEVPKKTPSQPKPALQPVQEKIVPPNEKPSITNELSNGTSSTVQNVAPHKPHFSDFFNDFKSSLEQEKQSTITEKAPSQDETFVKNEEEPTPMEISDDPFETSIPDSIEDPFTTDNTSEEFNFNFDPFSASPTDSSTTQEKEHPLSPDYVEPEREEVEDVLDSTINAYLQNISLQQEFLLKVIGNTGISRNSDLKEYLKDDEEGQKLYFVGKKYNANALNKDISDLRDKGILSSEQINYGGKGSGFIVYELSKIGKSCFKILTDENPVVAEKKRIVGTHASLEHGYLIKDSAKLFTEMGYKVYTDLEDVSFKIDERHRKVFDFIAENEEGKLLHIEVERGTHTQEDFSYAMDKIYEITKEFYFICPNESIKNKNTKKKFFTWVTKSLGGIQKADVILNMTTIEQLKKKSRNIWETTDLRNVK